MVRKPKKKKTKAGFFTKLLLLLLLAALSWQLHSLRTELQDAKIRQEKLAAQVEEKKQENQTLQEGIDCSGSKEEMERIARNELGLVSPGEKVFYDVSN